MDIMFEKASAAHGEGEGREKREAALRKELADIESVLTTGTEEKISKALFRFSELARAVCMFACKDEALVIMGKIPHGYGKERYAVASSFLHHIHTEYSRFLFQLSLNMDVQKPDLHPLTVKCIELASSEEVIAHAKDRMERKHKGDYSLAVPLSSAVALCANEDDRGSALKIVSAVRAIMSEYQVPRGASDIRLDTVENGTVGFFRAHGVRATLDFLHSARELFSDEKESLARFAYLYLGVLVGPNSEAHQNELKKVMSRGDVEDLYNEHIKDFLSEKEQSQFQEWIQTTFEEDALPVAA